MKVTTSAWPYLLLALSSLPFSQSVASPGPAVDSTVEAAAIQASRESELAAKLAAKLASYDIGTKDAPVDGKDGKPHAGPFVDPLPVKSSKEPIEYTIKTGAAADRVVPDDSVMNDPSRKPPIKGTTGTEGGVTEKARNRKAMEDETGEIHLKKPHKPKEPLPAHTDEGIKKADTPKVLDSDKFAYPDSPSDGSTGKKSIPGLKVCL